MYLFIIGDIESTVFVDTEIPENGGYSMIEIDILLEDIYSLDRDNTVSESEIIHSIFDEMSNHFVEFEYDIEWEEIENNLDIDITVLITVYIDKRHVNKFIVSFIKILRRKSYGV